MRPSSTTPSRARPPAAKRARTTRARASLSSPTVSPTSTRRAWVLSKKGNLKNLHLRTIESEPLGASDARVRVRAVGLNFADVFTALGLYAAAPEGAFTPGLECCGEILEVGRDVDDFRVGDRVMCVKRFGAFADEVTCPTTQMRVLPREWSFEQGAGFLVQGLTSYYGLKRLGDAREKSTVLVHSAAGGCGLASLGICERLGATAIAVIGDASKVETLKERFPKQRAIVVRDRKRFGAQVREACDAVGAVEGVDVVFDATLGDFFSGGWDNLARGGRYVVYGAADMTPRGDYVGVFGWIKLAWKFLKRKQVDPLSLPGENKGILGFNLIWQFDKTEELAALLAELDDLKLPAPKVGATFDFEELPEALRLFQTGKTTGKVVVRVD